MSSNAGSGGAISFAELLATLFIGLKLTGHIDWSWWWVLSPLWIGGLILAALMAVVFWIFK